MLDIAPSRELPSWSQSQSGVPKADLSSVPDESGTVLARDLGFETSGTWGVERLRTKSLDLCYEGGGGFRDDSRRSCAGGRL